MMKPELVPKFISMRRALAGVCYLINENLDEHRVLLIRRHSKAQQARVTGPKQAQKAMPAKSFRTISFVVRFQLPVVQLLVYSC